jgi:alkylation response protein AidB-like acyl-CoA dehydrogenase
MDQEFTSAVRSFIADRAPESEVRRLMATSSGYSHEVWQDMARQVGFQGVIVPEEYGGLGLDYSYLGLIFEEMGRALFCSPYFATIGLAANLLLQLDDPVARADYLPGIVAGDTIATVALADDGRSWQGPVTAEHGAKGWVLSGESRYVLDAGSSSVIFVLARTAEGSGVFAVETGAPEVTVRAEPTLDETRKLASVQFRGVAARAIAPGTGITDALERTLDRACIALACEQVGGAQFALQDAVAYAKARVQFGKPIGAFQALKHRFADMQVLVENARSAANYARWSVDRDVQGVGEAAAIAKSYCSDAYYKVAAENIQIHGGNGFTWEYSAHLYYKRAVSSQYLLGDSSFHLQRLADRIGL